jgi:hypothetical protein
VVRPRIANCTVSPLSRAVLPRSRVWPGCLPPLPRQASGCRGLRFAGASNPADRCSVVSPSRGWHSRSGRSWRRRGPTSLRLPRIMLVQTTKPDRFPVGHAWFLAQDGLTSTRGSPRPTTGIAAVTVRSCGTVCRVTTWRNPSGERLSDVRNGDRDSARANLGSGLFALVACGVCVWGLARGIFRRGSEFWSPSEPSLCSSTRP